MEDEVEAGEVAAASRDVNAAGVEVEVEEVVPIDSWDYRTYTGQAMEFKQRWNKHKWTFSDPTKILKRKIKGKSVEISIEEQIEEKRAESALADYVWKIKQKGLKPVIPELNYSPSYPFPP